MRGNHHILGRNDYTPPARLTVEQLDVVSSVSIQQRAGYHTWYEVFSKGQSIGYVRTVMHGQYFRTLAMDDWLPTCEDWNRDEPAHARAILKLLSLTHTHFDASRSIKVLKMNFSSIHGWNLLRSDKQAQAVAKRWLKAAQQSAVHEHNFPKTRFSWVDSEIVDGELTGHLTAFAVTLRSGQTILGIAPSLLSAQRRARKLLKHGHCKAAGVPPRQHLN